MNLEVISRESLQTVPPGKSTDHLHKLLKEVAKDYPLPDVRQSITYWVFPLLWRRTMIVVPQEWWYPRGIGRNRDGFLQVVMYVRWKRLDGEDIGYPELIEDHVVTLRTSVRIYPLTVQQGAFVGCKNLQAYGKYADLLCWGTESDVQKIQKEFPFR